MARTSVVTTCTRDCPNACGLLAEVEGGRVTALRGNPAHPLTRGFACGKCARFVARMESPERVLSPLRKEGGRWREISWDEALAEIAGRMTQIRARSGPEAILSYRGFAQRSALKLLGERFFNLFGGVTGTRGTLCGGTGEAAQNLDLGRRISHDPQDHRNSRALVLWGRNPAVTNPYLLPIMKDIRARGGRVVLVDPVASETAPLCDLHLQPRPGSDAWLALGLARAVLDRGGEDRAFIDHHSAGFATFEQLVRRRPLSELARRCDLAPAAIETLAGLLLAHRPAAISLGWGVHRYELGHQSVRAIDALAALLGNFGVAGGGVSQGFDEYAPYDLSWTGDHLHPGRRRLLLPRIGAEILAARDPAIEMIFVTAGNPVCMAPNAAKVREAFARTPFVVVAGHFLDDTAQMADIFLPTTTFLEEEDVTAGYGHNFIGPVHRAVAPPAGCRSDFRIFCALAERLGLADDFCLPIGTWLERLLAPAVAAGLDRAALAAGPVRIPGTPLVPYADRRFPTADGRFRFLGELEEESIDPEAAGYPLHLLSISPPAWLCSETTPADQDELTEIRVHPAAAADLGLVDGQEVGVESSTGRTRARLRLANGERGDVLVFPRGRWLASGSSANLLTRDLVSRVGEGAAYYDTRVRLVPPP